MATGFQEAGGM